MNVCVEKIVQYSDSGLTNCLNACPVSSFHTLLCVTCMYASKPMCCLSTVKATTPPHEIPYAFGDIQCRHAEGRFIFLNLCIRVNNYHKQIYLLLRRQTSSSGGVATMFGHEYCIVI